MTDKIFNRYTYLFYFQSHFLLFVFDFLAFVVLPAGFLLAAFTFRRCLAAIESPLLLPPILNIFVPHTEQAPDRACLPFFIVTCFSFFISVFDLHFTQYACVTNMR